jgi:hypothetical protein
MADKSGPQGLITLVCLTCGNEKFYDRAVPDAVRCERCQGTVFRSFATPTTGDEAVIAQLEEQARSIQYGDPSPETSREELRELDNL